MSQHSPRPAAALGTGLASALMILTGVLGITQGIAAIANDDVYSVVGKYSFKLDVSTWGWIHLAIGAVVLLTGFALFTGSILARAIGVLLAGAVLIVNFLDLPYEPYWSVIMIALNLFVIWSLFHDVGPDAA
jgi:hypothetical protein